MTSPNLGRLLPPTWFDQSGDNQFSGSHAGAAMIFAMIGDMIKVSGGTFQIDQGKDVMANGSLVAASINFSGQRPDHVMALTGVDVFSVSNSQINEVWLYSNDQAVEGAFWGSAWATPAVFFVRYLPDVF